MITEREVTICLIGDIHLVPRTGFEPVTLGLEVLCSIQLSYRGSSKRKSLSRFAKCGKSIDLTLRFSSQNLKQFFELI